MRSLALLPLSFTAVALAEPKLDFAYGILAEQRGDQAAAAAAIEKARVADPSAFPLVARVAGYKQRQGDIEGASTLYREFAKGHPERLDAQLDYADFLRSSTPDDDFATKMARDTLEAARKQFPDNLAIERRLFRIYEGLEQRDRSRAIFEALARPHATPSDTLAALEMARTLFSKDDESARAQLDEMLKAACQQSPKNAVLARAASEHFRTTGRVAEAAEILAGHVAAAPSSLELRTRLGILQLAAEKPAEGEKTLLAVLEIDPRQALAHQTLAKLYRKQGRIPEALPHASEALKIRGGDPSEFLQLADEFLAADQPREARLLLEKAVFFNQSDASLAVKLAVASRRDPETRERASLLFRQAENLSGQDGPAGDPVFLQEFSEILLQDGQTKAAEERLRAAIRAFPAEQRKETAAAMRRLAGIWQKENRNAEAANSLLQRADSLDPR
ncbi:tetratricopeptide repeat protein [Luteolibacter luteus]|uniref:Tetratricopeptide repeat protein n=1 Tax=Luteolibacter luteus TaxID=2728835 RepID=A0A858RL36_9BACT|nr:tetratricopeptide repeat protein [Luteolibacter luteus]QJE97099.1 tetratricopeptide repeat protein [Luteolibacter luteus]